MGRTMKNLRLETSIPKSKLEMSWSTKKQNSTPVTELRNFSEEIVSAWADLREIIGLVKALGDWRQREAITTHKTGGARGVKLCH